MPEERCCLVVDSGFSFTHFVPYVQGKIHFNPTALRFLFSHFFSGKRVRSAVRRLDVGGKLLTNHLKEVIILFFGHFGRLYLTLFFLSTIVGKKSKTNGNKLRHLPLLAIKLGCGGYLGRGYVNLLSVVATACKCKY